MTIRSTVKRFAAATFAIAALTVVGATSAQAAETSSPVANKVVASILSTENTAYAQAFNACVKAEAPFHAKALKNKSTRAAELAFIADKCGNVAAAKTGTAPAMQSASPVSVVASTSPVNVAAPTSPATANTGNDWQSSFDWSVPVDQIVRPEKACS